MSNTHHAVKNMLFCIFNYCKQGPFKTEAALFQHYCYHPRNGLARKLVQLQTKLQVEKSESDQK